jgi:hypothetical protein
MGLSPPGASVPFEDEAISEYGDSRSHRGGVSERFKETSTKRVKVEVEEKSGIDIKLPSRDKTGEGSGREKKRVGY